MPSRFLFSQIKLQGNKLCLLKRIDTKFLIYLIIIPNLTTGFFSAKKTFLISILSGMTCSISLPFWSVTSLCKERLEPEFIKYVLTYNKKKRPVILDYLKDVPKEKVLIFKHQKDLNAWLKDFTNNPNVLSEIK